jgi:hypothetical protein
MRLAPNVFIPAVADMRRVKRIRDTVNKKKI